MEKKTNSKRLTPHWHRLKSSLERGSHEAGDPATQMNVETIPQAH